MALSLCSFVPVSLGLGLQVCATEPYQTSVLGLHVCASVPYQSRMLICKSPSDCKENC